MARQAFKLKPFYRKIWICNMLSEKMNVYRQIIGCFKRIAFKKRKKILIISDSFKGGGLETRLNHIVNLYHQKYHFVLMTQTPRKDMKIPPNIHFQSILILPFEKRFLVLLLKICSFDFIDIHPFYTEWVTDLPCIGKKTKIIYTLHGIPSVLLFRPPLRPFDKIITVSQPLSDMFIQKFPDYQNKTLLVKNTYNTSNIPHTFHRARSVLLMLTNQTPIYEILNDIIDVLPPDYDIHYIGYPLVNQNEIKQFNRFIYDGFVDVSCYLKTHHFCLAICRGGYAAMDLIFHNIPTITVREKNSGGFYFDLITPDNFETLSNQNFVSWNPYHKKQSLAQIVPLLSGISSPFYNTCLSQFNSHKDIIDYYE